MSENFTKFPAGTKIEKKFWNKTNWIKKGMKINSTGVYMHNNRSCCFTGQAYSVVNIYIEGTTYGNTTDETRHYILVDLPVGEFDLGFPILPINKDIISNIPAIIAAIGRLF